MKTVRRLLSVILQLAHYASYNCKEGRVEWICINLVKKQWEVKRKLLHINHKCTNTCTSLLPHYEPKDVQLRLSSCISHPAVWLQHKA